MFKAKNRETQEIVALKRVRLDDDDEVGNISGTRQNLDSSSTIGIDGFSSCVCFFFPKKKKSDMVIQLFSNIIYFTMIAIQVMTTYERSLVLL